MCGIAGFVSDRHIDIDPARLAAMCDAMTHRGPDDRGVYHAAGVGLASRRLAILDLSTRGHMPMSSADGRFHIVYNGEVYNFRELREDLKSRGHTFVSETDTEVVLAMFAEFGPAMLHRLNGMFSIAIWDEVDRELFLARDRLGVKPLYHACQGGIFYFASEAKSLFAGGVQARFDHGCWEELLCFRYVAGSESVFDGVRRLLPGHYLVWKDGTFEVTRWWSLIDRIEEQSELRRHEPREWFARTFASSVQLRRLCDVPVGVLLSGGLDSSSIAAELSRQAGDGIAGFTVRFEDPEFDEGEYAREVASQFKANHYELCLSDSDLLDRTLEACWFNDEPLAHGHEPHILGISRLAKPKVSVLLSGEGSDETTGGYVRYRPLRHPSLLTAASSALMLVGAMATANSRPRKLSRLLRTGGIDGLMLYNSCNTTPSELATLGISPAETFPFRRAVLDEARRAYPDEPFRQMMYADQHTFLVSLLDRNDRMTMAASIECRVPFLDYRLVEGLASLPTSELWERGLGKAIVRHSVGSRLPGSVLRHKKWGFSVPWARYLRQLAGFREAVRGLSRCPLIRNGPFDARSIDNLATSFLGGDDRRSALLRQLVMISLWGRAWAERGYSLGS